MKREGKLVLKPNPPIKGTETHQGRTRQLAEDWKLAAGGLLRGVGAVWDPRQSG